MQLRPLSVVVPVAPAETEWQGLLAQLATDLPAGSEVLLVTADAERAPPAWPERIALRQLHVPGGRARQLNAGAAAAESAWLWFLHADSRLVPETVPAVQLFIEPGTEAAMGWFDLAFRPDGPKLMWLNAWGANLRSAWLGMPFGDQGFVLPAERFVALGGFDETARYGEDHLFAWTARQSGLPLRRLGATLLTSARKYQRNGWAATTTRHLWLTALQAWPEWRRLRRTPR